MNKYINYHKAVNYRNDIPSEFLYNLTENDDQIITMTKIREAYNRNDYSFFVNLHDLYKNSRAQIKNYENTLKNIHKEVNSLENQLRVYRQQLRVYSQLLRGYRQQLLVYRQQTVHDTEVIREIDIVEVPNTAAISHTI